MLLGGGAACPGCLQSDSTQKVSVIVNSVNGNLSPREFEWLNSTKSDGKSADWPSPRSEPSWDSVAKKLARPPKPELPTFAKLNRANMRTLRYLIWFIIFLSLGTFASRIPGTVGFSGFLIAFLVTTAIVVGWLKYSNRAAKHFQVNLDRWGQAQGKWYNLWYCARDNRVFIAGQRRLIEPEQMTAFLHE
jgi:hypothetical protein